MSNIDIAELKAKYNGLPGAQRLIEILGQERHKELEQIGGSFGVLAEKGLRFGGQERPGDPEGKPLTPLESFADFATKLDEARKIEGAIELFDKVCEEMAAMLEGYEGGEEATEA